MDMVTQSNVDVYQREAKAAFPHLSPLQAVLAFAIAEARDTLRICENADLASRSAPHGSRSNRDRKD